MNWSKLDIRKAPAFKREVDSVTLLLSLSRRSGDNLRSSDLQASIDGMITKLEVFIQENAGDARLVLFEKERSRLQLALAQALPSQAPLAFTPEAGNSRLPSDAGSTRSAVNPFQPPPPPLPPPSLSGKDPNHPLRPRSQSEYSYAYNPNRSSTNSPNSMMNCRRVNLERFCSSGEKVTLRSRQGLRIGQAASASGSRRAQSLTGEGSTKNRRRQKPLYAWEMKGHRQAQSQTGIRSEVITSSGTFHSTDEIGVYTRSINGAEENKDGVVDMQIMLTPKEFETLQSKIRSAMAEQKFLRRLKKRDSDERLGKNIFKMSSREEDSDV